MTIRNLKHKFIDFDFVELRFAPVLRLPLALYINMGDYYADFSIGQFQMKPSFATMIREQAPLLMGRKSGIIFKSSSEFVDNSSCRRFIVADLEDTRV